LAASGLPLSKSGVPFAPLSPYLPQYPRPSLSQEPAFVLARLIAPNIVDYFTKPTPPPQWVFPSIPGKIRSNDNPYAIPALLEAASFLGPGLTEKPALAALPLLARFLRAAEEVAPGMVTKVIGATGPLSAQTLDRATVQSLLREAPEEVLARIAQQASPENPQLVVGHIET
jgi:hypothetical protein